MQSSVGLWGNIITRFIPANSIILGTIVNRIFSSYVTFSMVGAVVRNSDKRMFVEDGHQLPQGFEDEKQGDQPSEDVLCKLCEESDQGGSLKPRNYQGDYEGPDADPDSPVQELVWHVFLTKVVESLVIKQDRSCGANDDERTAREESKDDTTSTGHH